ncbi:MAG TPA: M15 family metallopeptidase [Mycobacterium sp.]
MKVNEDQAHPFVASRRRVLQACAVVVGAGLLAAHGSRVASAAISTAADDPATGAGADGAPGPSGAPKIGTLAVPAGGTSYNGWPVGTPASAIGVQNFVVPGTNVTLPIKAGDVATVLLYVAQRFNAEVETLEGWQCWGYAYRANVNNPSVWSNHASGTAIDLNAVKHPNGARATFTAAQTAAVRRILTFCGKVVYWGQDYTGTVDGMHFEIDVPPGDPSLGLLAARIRAGGEMPPLGCLDSVTAQPNSKVRLNGWAFDPDDPAAPLWVAVYMDGQGVGWFATTVSRPDVNNVFGIRGIHGYSILVEAPPGDHMLDVYAINAAGGPDNPHIGRMNVRVGLPAGCLDRAVASGDTVTLQGWAFDTDQPNTSIQVAVYRNGEGVGWFPTGGGRPDVNSVFDITGRHGFSISVQSPPGAQRFDLYAINVGPPTDNVYFGSGSVTVG